MRILAFAASLRRESYNRKLIQVAARILRENGADVDLADFREFDMPLYDGDVDAARGRPPGARKLCERLERAEGLVLAVPEYNYSIPGTLKNAIDWVSRIRPIPWRGKSTYLISAAPSPMGGIRGLWQTRIPLEGCGALVFPDMFALPHADKAFAPDGRLIDVASRERLERELVGFLRVAERLAPATVVEGAPTREQRQVAAALSDEDELQPESSPDP